MFLKKGLLIHCRCYQVAPPPHIHIDEGISLAAEFPVLHTLSHPERHRLPFSPVPPTPTTTAELCATVRWRKHSSPWCSVPQLGTQSKMCMPWGSLFIPEQLLSLTHLTAGTQNWPNNWKENQAYTIVPASSPSSCTKTVSNYLL